jgi:limonene-1,2-epoxide hydrolase
MRDISTVDKAVPMQPPADGHRIRDLAHFLSLWQNQYADKDKPDWEGILPYYHKDIVFTDSVQKIRGIGKFAAMTRRLLKRSRNMEFRVHNSVMKGDLIFMEWEMVISYGVYPKSSVFGASRVRLRDGKVVEQRDYYDLWGDIFDNIPLVNKAYRWFMRTVFG